MPVASGLALRIRFLGFGFRFLVVVLVAVLAWLEVSEPRDAGAARSACRALIVQNVWPKRKRNCRKLLLGTARFRFRYKFRFRFSPSTSDALLQFQFQTIIIIVIYISWFLLNASVFSSFHFSFLKTPPALSQYFFLLFLLLVWLRFYKVIGFCFASVEIYFGYSLSRFMGNLVRVQKDF